MGLFDRLSAMLRSNINDLISRAENPEKMLNQLILDMKTQLAKAKQQVASAIADERKLQSDAEDLKKQAEDWERRAMMAVQEGRDDLAKQALGRYNEQLQAAQQLQETWLRHKAETEQLKLSLRQLNDKIEEAKRKKNILVARSKRAEAQQRIQETMSGLSDKSAFESFERMAEKIEATERKALAAAELNEEVSGDRLARQFEALEYKGSSDQQLHRAEDQDGYAELRPGQGFEAAGRRRRRRPRRRVDGGGGRREVALTYSAEAERRRGFPVGRVLLAVVVVALAIKHRRRPAGPVPGRHSRRLPGRHRRFAPAPPGRARLRALGRRGAHPGRAGRRGPPRRPARGEPGPGPAHQPPAVPERAWTPTSTGSSAASRAPPGAPAGGARAPGNAVNELFGFLRGAAVPYLKGGVEVLIGGVSVLVMAILPGSPEPVTYVEGVVALVPPPRPRSPGPFCRISITIRAWVVGQIIAMVLLAALTTLGLWALGMPYFLAFGVFAGVAAIVPFFGVLLSTLLPALFALGAFGLPKASP